MNQTYIPRIIEVYLKDQLGKGQALVIYGPRQTGKTTLARQLLKNYHPDEVVSFQADDLSQAALFEPRVDVLKRLVGDKKALFIDEAQTIANAGLVLKLLVDTFPALQVIATASSSFYLSDKIKESMVGRALEVILLPFSAEELAHDPVQQMTYDFRRALRLGSYPAVALSDDNRARELLTQITDSYLYKDVLTLTDTRNPEILRKLLTALALQVGQEVSYNELASMLEVSRTTIERYIYLLEQCFVIFRLQPLSSNPRKLLASRKRKIYFYDLGIRSSLAGQLDIEVDYNTQLGGLFENYVIVERLKAMHNHRFHTISNYWRSPDSEVDYVEQASGKVYAYEIKWQKKLRKLPPTFLRQFPSAQLIPVTRESFWDFLAIRPS